MKNSQNEKFAEAICPILGLPTDPLTAMNYPSSQNYCCHVTPAAAPGAAHQRKFCLALSFKKCPLYAARSTKPMPAEYLADPIIIKKETHVLRWMVTGFIILAVIAVALVLAVNRGLPAALVRTPTAPQLTLTKPAAKAAAKATVTIMHTPLPSPTTEPSSIQTLTPLSPHLLETRFGTQRQFLLHRVLEGESLNLLAITYHTSTEAIRAVNYNLPATLWENTVIIIPPDQTDMAGVTPMTGYPISPEKITIQALALEKGVSLDALCSINGLPDDYLFKPGEWVIIPATPEAP